MRPNEYDEKLRTRKAIYKPYAQAIPGAYVIEKYDRSPCTNACPNRVNAHAYVALIAQGKYREAMEVILRTLPFPGVIGRICPHPCESACRRGDVDEPVSICSLKRFVADRVDIEDVPLPKIEKQDEKVAIIGSGPAGLTAAHFLALAGYEVTVFEALPVSGGMLRVGIPDYRLPPEVLDKEIRAITRLGVEIKLNTALGRDITIEELFSLGYRAIYIAIGAHKSLKLNIPGEDVEGVIPGVEFLRRVNLGELNRLQGRVVVVGGGDVAVDAARSALRLGAEKVTIVYRRTREEMPAREEEVEDALAEGVEIQFLCAPQKVVTEAERMHELFIEKYGAMAATGGEPIAPWEGRVFGIECLQMALGEPDESGRRRPLPLPGSEFFLEAEVLIPAIGQEPDASPLVEPSTIELTERSTLAVDPITYATSREGVFAGGDVQTGPGIAINAIAAGREAAISISRYLKGEDLRAGRERIELPQEDFLSIPAELDPIARTKMPALSIFERKRSFAEVQLGLTEEQAKTEAQRCLNCMACCECLLCEAVCKAGAIRHDQLDEEVVLKVGSIIAAPGFSEFDPSQYDEYGYACFANVVTSTEFERILSASGPTQGHLARPSDHEEPKRIAWLQCVGSRDINHCDNSYCSAVCCMYALKEALVALEHSKNSLECAIFFMDMRTYGKDFERYYEQAKEKGVRFIRSRVHTIDQISGSEDLEISYASEAGEIQSEIFDMVVLSVGLESSPTARELAKKLGIELDHYNFAATNSFAPVSTSRPGIYACGAFQGPKDIPYSVMEASAAAGATSSQLSSVRGALAQKKTFPPEQDVTGQRPRVGVFVCNCGINIGGVVRVSDVVAYAKTLPNVVYTQENLFSCSQDAQERMRQVIIEQKLNRVVVAACSPRTHEPLFQETMKAAGLNKYLFEMANIRDQDSWVHQNDPTAATEKAKTLVRMAVAKGTLLEALEEKHLAITPVALVVGGGLAGMQAALTIAESGYEVHLVEKTDRLGGQANHIHWTWKGEDVQTFRMSLENEVRRHPLIRLHLGVEVTYMSGFVGNFRSTITRAGTRQDAMTIDHGAVVLATGGKPYHPKDYLYGEHPRVFMWNELDDLIVKKHSMVTEGKCGVFIQCVGSRNQDRPYCSRICCTHSLRTALKVKEINPEMNIYILYRDLRTYGPREDLYAEARSKGIIFSRYSLEDMPKVRIRGDEQLEVEMLDHVLDRPIILKPDFVNLATAIVPAENEEIARLLKVPLNQDGFFMEAHAKLRPVDFATDGVFVCGLAHYPKDIEESLTQAMAAAARTVSVLAKEIWVSSGLVAQINSETCVGCQGCLKTCPYEAIDYLDDQHICKVNMAICKGCGSCAAVCPSGSARLSGFERKQINAQVVAAMKGIC